MKTIRVILVSDNHGQEEPLQDVRAAYPHADFYLHCGDSEMPRQMLDGFACVRGNNDYYDEYPMMLTLDIGTHRFLMVHGHRNLWFMDPTPLAALARQQHCDVACFGHTHVYYDETVDGIRLLNPGSIWRNRDGSIPSFMDITISDGRIHVQRINYRIGADPCIWK